MGTRADFYVGRGPDAEWLGSIGYDGYPSGISRDERHPDRLDLGVTEEGKWRSDVGDFLAGSTCATLPDQGWPWPWDDSQTTDYSYAYDGGRVWGTCFGRGWWPADQPEPDNHDEDKVEFPNMAERANVQIGTPQSGVIVFGLG